ncbi:Fic family protein [Stenotrophomonas sp. G106K1]|uniref:Fic family protein n=1 Tax=Stenotrophomonas sp. G106K1 TaxID=3134792 RepID=UPI0030F3F266
MDITFTCSGQWIADAFSQLRLSCDVPLRRDVTCPLPVVTALLLHDSFDHSEVFGRNLERHERLHAQGMLELALGRAFSACTLGQLSMALETITCMRPAQRMHGIGIVTQNSYSRRFRGPPAVEAIRASVRLFNARRRRSERSGIERALATYLVLLSIHPFVDGNGRTARMLFAADMLAHDGHAVPRLMLGLILLHRGRGRLFHLAAMCARTGDFSMLATCYSEALTLADRFLPALCPQRGRLALFEEYQKIDALLKRTPEPHV